MCLFQPWFSEWDIYLGVGLLGHMVVLLPVFKGISIPSPIVAVSIYIPSNNARAFPFLHTVSSICRLFDDGHSDWSEAISHCSFDLHFSNNEQCWTYFHVFVSHLYIFLGGEGNGNPLQYSCLENPMDIGAWWAAVHGVTQSQTRLSDFTFTLHFHALEKEMATHSSVLAWRIPGTGEPGGLPSMGSHRVGHDWSDLA